MKRKIEPNLNFLIKKVIVINRKLIKQRSHLFNHCGTASKKKPHSFGFIFVFNNLKKLAKYCYPANVKCDNETW